VIFRAVIAITKCAIVPAALPPELKGHQTEGIAKAKAAGVYAGEGGMASIDRAKLLELKAIGATSLAGGRPAVQIAYLVNARSQR
jgi:hypothetical protein